MKPMIITFLITLIVTSWVSHLVFRWWVRIWANKIRKQQKEILTNIGIYLKLCKKVDTPAAEIYRVYNDKIIKPLDDKDIEEIEKQLFPKTENQKPNTANR